MIKFISSFFKIKQNWCLFYDVFSRNGNGDSIRPIAIELRKRCPNMKFIFVAKRGMSRDIDMADEVVIEKSLRFKFISRLAKFIVSPMGFPNKGDKRKGQYLIQTWHGTPLKKLYLSKDKNNASYRRYAKQFFNTNIFCISCDFAREAFKEALNLKDNQFIESGLPRNDVLNKNVDTQSLKDSIKKSLGLPMDKKVIFYCPTWRRYDYKALLPFNLNTLKKELSNDYVILIRSHVGKHKWIDEKNKPVEIFDNVFSFNGGDWPEATELYLIADILVSDYSSSIFDFAITRKPQIMYAYDVAEYTNEFGLYFDYADFVAFPVAKNTEEFVESIKDIDNFDSKYGKQYADFIDKFCTFEKGDATQQVVNYIVEKI